MRKSSIKTKLVISFSLIALVAVSVAGLSAILGTRKILEQTIQDKVLLFAEIRERQSTAYYDYLKTSVASFASDGFIKDDLQEIIKTGSASAVEMLSSHLVKNKKTLDSHILGINILDLDGNIVASTESYEIGARNESDDTYFTRGKEEVYLMDLSGHEHFEETDVFAVGAPIIDKNSDKLIGVINVFFDTKGLREILEANIPSHDVAKVSALEQAKTLSTYLINQDGKVVIDIRKDYKKVIKNINTLPVQRCLANKEETISKYINHFNEESIGISICLPSVRWILLVEISAAEAAAPANDVTSSLEIMLIFVLLFVILNIILVANNIVRPIVKFRDAANFIALGDLDYRLDIKTKDEMGELARAFNFMAANLKKNSLELQHYSQELEEKVAEKTKDLQHKVDDLDQAREAILNVAEDAEEEKQKTAKEKIKAEAIARELEKFKLAVDNVSDQIIITDSDGNIMYVNNAAEKITGYSAEEAIGQKAGKLWGSLMDKSYYENLWATIKIDKKHLLVSSPINAKTARHTPLFLVFPRSWMKIKILYFSWALKEIYLAKKKSIKQKQNLSLWHRTSFAPRSRAPSG